MAGPPPWIHIICLFLYSFQNWDIKIRISIYERGEKPGSSHFGVFLKSETRWRHIGGSKYQVGMYAEATSRAQNVISVRGGIWIFNSLDSRCAVFLGWGANNEKIKRRACVHRCSGDRSRNSWGEARVHRCSGDHSRNSLGRGGALRELKMAFL